MHGKLLHRFQRIDEVDTFAEHVTGNFAEEREHADVARGDRSNARIQQDQNENCGREA